MNGRDWLEDPLMIGYYKFRRLKGCSPEQSDFWQSFHFATRLKLDGAAHFCRQLLGAASLPYDLGLPLSAHRQLKWYLDAFFFELMSAYDTLLQELNVVYAYDKNLKPDDVRYQGIKEKLPKKLDQYVKQETGKEWFEKVRKYRNVATHHHPLPTGWQKAGFGDQPLDYDEHKVYIHYLDNTGNMVDEEVNVCVDYLKNMVGYISSVWGMMKERFD